MNNEVKYCPEHGYPVPCYKCGFTPIGDKAETLAQILWKTKTAYSWEALSGATQADEIGKAQKILDEFEQSHPAPTDDLLLTDEQFNQFRDKFGWIVKSGCEGTPEKSPLESSKLVDLKYQFHEVAQAQLSHATPLIDKKAREETRKAIGKQLEKVVDDNYKDRVIIWDVLKEFIDSLKAGEPLQGGVQ